jgi:CcmD family protein
MKTFFQFVLLFLICLSSYSQETQSIEMADVMRSSGKIYVVVAVLAVVFSGIAIYLFSIDNRLKKLENKNNK